MLIALARKLIVTLWRYVETGLIPTAPASLRPALSGKAPRPRKGSIFRLPDQSGFGEGRRVFEETIGVDTAGKKFEPAKPMLEPCTKHCGKPSWSCRT